MQGSDCKSGYKMGKRVAIVGAGNSGISAFNACREQGFDVVCYEVSDHICGLWKFSETGFAESASIYRSIVINTSKEMTAFSDFPVPKEYPNFMHHSLMAKYIESFADKIGFKEFVKLGHKVIKCVPNHDYQQTGKWMVTVQRCEDNSLFDEVFDAVMLCTGFNNKPLMPVFDGQHLFRGKIIHSNKFRDTNGFEGKRVVMVGIGNSGGDIACELSNVSEKVYLSTRTGSWCWSKIGHKGWPFDTMLSRRFVNYLFKYLPYWLICTIGEYYLNNRFDHKLYGLQPKHRLFSQHVVICDDLPKKIASGQVMVRGDIDRFTEDGVIFQGEDIETQIDVVIIATGYEVSYPMLDESSIGISDYFSLYKSVYFPHLSHPETLGLIGLIRPTGAVLPLSEMQSRWFAMVLSGKVSLPSQHQMFDQIDKRKQFLKKRYPNWKKHTLAYFWVSYMEDIAATIGVKPNLLKYFFTDIRLWFKLIFGPLVPAHYRLEGPNSWTGARETIMTVNDRIQTPFINSRNSCFLQ